MKKTKLFAILVLNVMTTMVFAQYNPSISASEKDGLVNYTIQNAGAQTHVFVFNGDGTFGIQIPPKHKFAPDSTGYTTEAYFVRRYDTNLPTRRTTQTGRVESGSSYTNPPLKMSTPIDIMTSWATAYNYEHFYILGFQNTSSDTVKGCIDFSYHTSEMTIDTPNIRVYNNWVSNRTSSTLTGSLNKKQQWDFIDLLPNEIRYVYIPSFVKVKPGKMINTSASYKVNCSSNGSGSGSTTSRSVSRRYPHDPNFKIVDKDCYLPFFSEKQKLTYMIGFFNDGEDYAQNVYLTDELSSFLIPSNFAFLDAEYPGTVSIQINQNEVKIDLINIMLPGTNQTIPKAFSYDDAFSYVIFSVCTVPNLLPGCIENQAEIIFDNESSFITNIAETCTYYTPESGFSCIDPISTCVRRREATYDYEVEELPVGHSPVSFQVYPSPFVDLINVSVAFQPTFSTGFTIELMDYTGKTIKQLSQSDGQFELFEKQFYLDDLPKGIYLMVLKTKHAIYTEKIIKL